MCVREKGRTRLLHASGDFLGRRFSKGMSTFFSPGKNNSISIQKSHSYVHAHTWMDFWVLDRKELPHLLLGSLIFTGQGAKLRRAGHHQPEGCGHTVTSRKGRGASLSLRMLRLPSISPSPIFLFSPYEPKHRCLCKNHTGTRRPMGSRAVLACAKRK